MRTLDEIRAVGVAWLTETELEHLIDLAKERDGFKSDWQTALSVLGEKVVAADAKAADLAKERDALREALVVSHAARHGRMFAFCEEGACAAARAALVAREGTR